MVSITYDPPLKKFHNRTDANEAIALKMSFAKCIKRDGKNYNKKKRRRKPKICIKYSKLGRSSFSSTISSLF